MSETIGAADAEIINPAFFEFQRDAHLAGGGVGGDGEFGVFNLRRRRDCGLLPWQQREDAMGLGWFHTQHVDGEFFAGGLAIGTRGCEREIKRLAGDDHILAGLGGNREAEPGERERFG